MGFKPFRLLVLMFLLLILSFEMLAQSPPISTAPAAPPPSIQSAVEAVDQAPDSSTTQWTYWGVSVAGNGLATYLKWSSSWKQPIDDPIRAQPNGPYQGRYYVRGSVYDWGLFGLTTGVQYVLCRKFPSLRKTFAYVNFGNSAVGFAQFGYNSTNH
jgi:hypothetical protein